MVATDLMTLDPRPLEHRLLGARVFVLDPTRPNGMSAKTYIVEEVLDTNHGKVVILEGMGRDNFYSASATILAGRWD